MKTPTILIGEHIYSAAMLCLSTYKDISPFILSSSYSSFPFAFPSGLGSPFRLRLASAVTYRTTTEERIRVQRQPKETPAPVLFCFLSLSLSYKKSRYNREVFPTVAGCKLFLHNHFLIWTLRNRHCCLYCVYTILHIYSFHCIIYS